MNTESPLAFYKRPKFFLAWLMISATVVFGIDISNNELESLYEMMPEQPRETVFWAWIIINTISSIAVGILVTIADTTLNQFQARHEDENI